MVLDRIKKVNDIKQLNEEELEELQEEIRDFLVENIAKTCVESNACRYSYFKKLLKNMQDNHSVPTTSSLPEHSNLRGKEEYR